MEWWQVVGSMRRHCCFYPYLLDYRFSWVVAVWFICCVEACPVQTFHEKLPSFWWTIFCRLRFVFRGKTRPSGALRYVKSRDGDFHPVTDFQQFMRVLSIFRFHLLLEIFMYTEIFICFHLFVNCNLLRDFMCWRFSFVLADFHLYEDFYLFLKIFICWGIFIFFWRFYFFRDFHLFTGFHLFGVVHPFGDFCLFADFIWALIFRSIASYCWTKSSFCIILLLT